MGFVLVVVRPFADRVIGDVITDPDEVARLALDENGDRVVRVARSDEHFNPDIAAEAALSQGD